MQLTSPRTMSSPFQGLKMRVSIDGRLQALKTGENKRCGCLESEISQPGLTPPHRNKQSSSLWGWLPTVNGLGPTEMDTNQMGAMSV
jgi:hypothetical protein